MPGCAARAPPGVACRRPLTTRTRTGSCVPWPSSKARGSRSRSRCALPRTLVASTRCCGGTATT
eukprot:5044607-Alexandrium_andersonii.AAC.1